MTTFKKRMLFYALACFLMLWITIVGFLAYSYGCPPGPPGPPAGPPGEGPGANVVDTTTPCEYCDDYFFVIEDKGQWWMKLLPLPYCTEKPPEEEGEEK